MFKTLSFRRPLDRIFGYIQCSHSTGCVGHTCSYKFILRSNRQRKKNVRKQTVKFDVVNPIYGLYYFSDGQQVDETTYMCFQDLQLKYLKKVGPILEKEEYV